MLLLPLPPGVELDLQTTRVEWNLLDSALSRENRTFKFHELRDDQDLRRVEINASLELRWKSMQQLSNVELMKIMYFVQSWWIFDDKKEKKKR